MNDVRNNPLKCFYFQFYCYFMNYQVIILFIPAELLFRFFIIPVSLFITVSLLRKTLTDQICRYIDVSQYSLIFKLVRLYFIFSPGNCFIKATCDRFK